MARLWWQTIVLAVGDSFTSGTHGHGTSNFYAQIGVHHGHAH